MILIVKIAVMFFVLGLMMVGLAGIASCIQLIQKANSTIRTIIYTEIIIIVLVTFCMNLSYKSISVLELYGIGFIIIGFCSIPVRVFVGLINSINKEKY